VKGALYAPTCGVIDPFELCVHLMENAMDNGAKLFLNEEVVEIRSFGELYEVRTKKNTYYAKYIINASGVQADFISQTVAPKTFSIAPRKGEYYVLDYTQTPLVNHVVFPLPSVLGKGILVTPTYGGNYLVGPSSAFIDDKTDLSTDVMTLNEVKKSASQLIKNIPFNKVIRAFAGLRASPSTHDFIIEEAAPNFINVAGIESPGLASSPAIAKKVVEEFIAKKIKLIPNPNFVATVRPYHRFKQTSESDWQQLIAKDKRYARMVCRCETVSEGEIRDLLNRNCPPHSIKGVKKRVRAGFGRCQGGFCAPNVLAILADHYHIKVTEVPYDELGTNILKQPTKEVGE
jgi:glycerol-3-phosphate dehydrogenase